MKTIYITEKQKEILKEESLLKSIPNELILDIEKNRTSLGNNPALPNIFDKNFLETISEKRFEEVKDILKRLGSIKNVKSTDPSSAMGELINKAQSIEKPFRNELEKVCMNYLIDLFQIPQDKLSLKLSLVDKVGNDFCTEPADSTDTFEYADLIEMDKIKDEVYKRRLLSVLSMGAAIRLSEDFLSYTPEISENEKELTKLYYQIMALNDYLLFTKADIEINDEDKKQSGFVNVNIGSEDEKISISAQGVILPILIHETIKGFMELFISHGLPKDRRIADAVLQKSDFLKAEPWDMRLGPVMWDIFNEMLETDDNTELLPYIIKEVSMLEIDEFNAFFKEIFAKTLKGRYLLKKIVSRAEDEKSYDRFEKKMDKIKNNRNLIADDNIQPEELMF